MAALPSNPNWSLNAATAAFDGDGPHAEIIKVLHAFDRRDFFLNVGYSRRTRRHWSPKAQTRLVDRLAKRMLRRTTLDPDLIDIGCGRGGPAVRLHQKWNLNVTGVDLSETNLEIARRKTRDLAIHEGLTFRRGSAGHLPFSNETFSYAWSIESMAYVPEKEVAFEEIHRILKPGGRLAMAALLLKEDAVGASAENRQAYAAFLEAWDFHSLFSADAYTTAISESGFDVKKMAIVTHRTLDPHKKRLSRLLRLWQNGAAYKLSRWYLRRRAEADLEPIREQLELTHRVLEAGLLDYGLFWASAV